MAKTDNTKQVIYDLKSVVLDTDSNGELIFTNDEIESVKVNDILSEYFGKEIDFKIGGAVKISPELFTREDDN